MVYVHIELDNVSRSFFSGQVVIGRVIIKNNKSLKIKEVTVQLEGSGCVSWSESQDHTVAYRASDTYVSQKISLVGDGRNFMTFKADETNTYPFQFLIPPDVPSSFNSRNGSISYSLEAEIHSPTLMPNVKNTVVITVIKHRPIYNVDLYKTSGALNQQKIHKVKGPSIYAGRNGKIEFGLTVRQSGFVPGEILDFSCRVTNGSNKTITGMKASLNQVAKFYAQGHVKTETKDMFWVLDGPEVKPGDPKLWIPNNLCIPVIPPTWKTRILEIQYFLHFELSISGVTNDMSADIPIVIGTIPLRSNFGQYQPPQILYNPLPPSCSSAVFCPEDCDLPPPTYEEAVFGHFIFQ